MNKKILIFGRGFIGEKLQEGLACGISEERINSLGDAETAIEKYNPRIIINCIGQTGSRSVDDCERDKDSALFANTYVPLILAEVALRRKLKLIHISSGCIYHFDYRKDRPITEERIPDFFDLYYSRTKIYAELPLKTLANKFNILVLRIRIPLDNKPHPRNILTKLIRYKKIIDIPNSVTYLPSFIDALKHLIRINATGLYNCVNRGALRYPDLMEVYKKYVPSFEYNIIAYKALRLTRTNLLLSTAKLEKTGFRMPAIRRVLEECVKTYLSY